MAQQLGIADEISFLGYLDDIPRFLSALDGIAMPSRYEGFPLAVLEALASGLPVVASRVGGIPEILTTLADKWWAFLVSPENVKELGTAMKNVMSWSKSQRMEVVGSIMQEAQLFDSSPMIARMDSLYREVMSSFS